MAARLKEKAASSADKMWANDQSLILFPSLWEEGVTGVVEAPKVHGELDMSAALAAVVETCSMTENSAHSVSQAGMRRTGL